MRFLLTADVHLGRRFSRLPPAAAEVCRADLREAFRQLVALALARNVDCLLIAGDLFDEAIPSPELVRFARHQLEVSLAGRVEVYAVTGNHDPCVPGSPYRVGGLGPASVFTTPAWERREILGGRCALFGIGYDHENESRRVLAELAHIVKPAQVPQIVLVHADFEAGQGQKHYMPFSCEDAAALPVEFIGLGHVHEPWQPVRDVAAHYPGSIAFISMKSRVEQFGCLQIDLHKGLAASIERVAMGPGRLRRIEIDITGHETAELVREAINSSVAHDQVIHVTLTGLRSPRLALTPEALEAELSEVSLAAVVDDQTRTETKVPAAPGTVKAAFLADIRDQLAALGSDADDERRELGLALAYGLAALDGERL